MFTPRSLLAFSFVNTLPRMLLATAAMILFAGTQTRTTGQDNAPDRSEVKEQVFYYVLKRDDLKLSIERMNYYRANQLVPHAILDGVDEAWVCPKRNDRYQVEFEIAIRSIRPLKRISGRVYLGGPNPTKLAAYKIDVEPVAPATPKEFYACLANYYEFLVQGNYTGKVWFRHRLDQVSQLLGQSRTTSGPRRPVRQNSFDRTFDVFSGDRALVENLQLDRSLILQGDNEALVDVEGIAGITIGEVNWDQHLDEKVPELDRLAGVIPEDQHAIFLSSPVGLQQALQEFSSLVLPSLNAFSVGDNDREILPNYFRQMAIDLNEINQQEFAKSIQSIAITGSDPYSELGTDVGVLVHMKDEAAAQAVTDYFLQKIGSTKAWKGIPNSGSQVADDRSLSAICFRRDRTVVIANSDYQIQSILAVMKGQSESLSGLKEYRFFRQRYKKSEAETAFVFMSDAAIRRWCSPRWRIGQSRRLRALALLERLQAKHLGKCLAMQPGDQEVLKLEGNWPEWLGKVYINHQGIYSSRYGSHRWMTPIAEMEINKVTARERDSYVQWRDGYQRNWSRAFDPIGIQLMLKPESVTVDFSVIPLILSSSYRWMTNGKPFEPFSGDLHPGTLVHLMAAPGIDRFLQPYLNGLEQVEVFADDDNKFWRDFTDVEEAEKYFRENVQSLPVAFVFHFDNQENMQKALDKTKTFVTSNIVDETELKHQGQVFRALAFDEQFIRPRKNLQLYVYKSDAHVTFSLSKDLIHRVIERETNNTQQDSVRPWLGKNLAVQLDQRFFRALEGLSAEQYGRLVRTQSWSNLPLLNEWKREFPDQDPWEIQRRFFGERLVCSGDGEYRWDDETSTYYSTALGSPVQPRIPMGTPFPLRGIKYLDAGVSFDTGGIRAKLILQKK